MQRLRLLTLIAAASVALAQTSAIEQYFQNPDVKRIAALASGARTDDDIRDVLPGRVSQRFADYAAARLSLGSLLQSVDKLRLNKLVANTPGPAGSTALVSRVSVPSILRIRDRVWRNPSDQRG